MENELLGFESLGLGLDFLTNFSVVRDGSAFLGAVESADQASVMTQMQTWTPSLFPEIDVWSSVNSGPSNWTPAGATASNWTPLSPT